MHCAQQEDPTQVVNAGENNADTAGSIVKCCAAADTARDAGSIVKCCAAAAVCSAEQRQLTVAAARAGRGWCKTTNITKRGG